MNPAGHRSPGSRSVRPRTRRLAVVALAVALTTGCSSGVTLTPPSPTSSPTSSTGSGSATGAGPTATSSATAQTTRFTPGAPGVGDPYFPLEGNGGYEADHYDLDLSYDPAARHLAGTVTITATATQNLSRFDLDLSGMTVAAVSVDDAAATWTRSGQELRITPAQGLPDGDVFHVAVRYAGTPATIVGSPVLRGAPYGWIYTTDGAFVGDEPTGASTWFPCNDHPSDKATYTFTIAVPSDRQVVSNGDLVSRRTSGHTATFVWNEASPMATYLATIGIGRWTFQTGTTLGGIRELMAYDPSLSARVTALKDFALTGQITDYWTKVFGPYPFTSTGAIVDNVPGVGFSLETQTRPLYGYAPDPILAAHELSHEWFGDSVSVQTWRDIWLNEGFATFAQYLWVEHLGHASTWALAQQMFAQYPTRDSFWNQAIADPQRNTMFSPAVYVRGGLTLAALRHRIGDQKFFSLLQQWTAAHRYANATTSQFIALANQVSGQNLDHFFQIWLYAKSRPASLTAS